MDDNSFELKIFQIFGIAIISIMIFGVIAMHLQHTENIKAMENGYIQVIEGKKVLWKKQEMPR